MDIDFEQVLVDLIMHSYQESDRVSLNYMEDFVNLVIEKEDLYSYIKYIDLYHNSWNENDASIMCYNPITKTININYEKQRCKKVEEGNNSFFNYFYFNCNLFHELYHVKELKIMQEENTLIARLLQLFFKRLKYYEKYTLATNSIIKTKNKYILKHLNALYKTYYLFDLSERLAYLYSYQMSSKLAKRMGLKEFEDFWKLKEYDFYTFWRTHKSPTLFYLEKICSKQELNQIKEEIESLQMPFEERLQLGLKLTPKEFESVLEKKISLVNSMH